MPEAPRVDIVVPSWNGKGLLADCLESLACQTFRDFRAIIVDDASTDGTAEMVRERFPWAQVLRFDRNSGFCAAVNAGIELCLGRSPAVVGSIPDRSGSVSGGQFILLLNNDITLHPECLVRLVDAADEKGAGMVAPLILWRDQADVIYSAGDKQRVNGRPESVGFMSPCSDFAYPETVFGVSAAAALYRREVYERVGLFDCRFGTYFSDSDLSFRARLAGYEALFVRDAVAYHVGSASLGGSTLKRTRECCINHAILVIKDMPGPLLARYAPHILLERAHQVRRLFSAARAERGAIHAMRNDCLRLQTRECGPLETREGRHT
jgi:GT2 family glycosyltransferase